MIHQITTGDARELAKNIPDESVNLVFTDPVYENLEDYRWLGETAMRVLKPNGVLLAWCSTRHAARSQISLEESGLNYQWTLYYFLPGKPGAKHLYGIYPCITPCFLFAKGHHKASPYLPDGLLSADAPDNGFKWQKNTKIIRRWLTAFSSPGDLVFDPFSGSGSTGVVAKQSGRDFIGFEIEPGRAELARQRVQTAPLPLFMLEPEAQVAMFEEILG